MGGGVDPNANMHALGVKGRRQVPDKNHFMEKFTVGARLLADLPVEEE